MEPNTCPHCREVLTDEQVVRLYKRYVSSRRIVKAGGKNGGRPLKVAAKETDWASVIRERKGVTETAQALGKPPAVIAEQQKPAPEPTKGNISELRDLLRKTEDRVRLGQPANVAATPLEQSESRRSWSEEWARLEEMGRSDEGGAAEAFGELLKGTRTPGNFARWTRGRKIDWLVENVPLPEGS